MTATELAKLYNASPRTIKRWRKLNAPLDDQQAMQAWIAERRSRMGVGKYSRRTSEPAPVAPIREVAVQIMSDELQAPAKCTPVDDDEGTLRRLEEAERIAYRRYVDTGGSERAAQIWLLCTDQLRKYKDSMAKHAADVSEAETKFMGSCCAVIDNLYLHLQTAPKLLGMLCEGLDRDVIEAKIADQLNRTIQYAVAELADQIRGTSLERLLPAQ
jgi:hypothetical protein